MRVTSCRCSLRDAHAVYAARNSRPYVQRGAEPLSQACMHAGLGYGVREGRRSGAAFTAASYVREDSTCPLHLIQCSRRAMRLGCLKIIPQLAFGVVTYSDDGCGPKDVSGEWFIVFSVVFLACPYVYVFTLHGNTGLRSAWTAVTNAGGDISGRFVQQQRVGRLCVAFAMC